MSEHIIQIDNDRVDGQYVSIIPPYVEIVTLLKTMKKHTCT